MPRFRFLDAMGDVVAEREFPDAAAARAWARDPGGGTDDGTDGGDDPDGGVEQDVQRVEFLGPDGDWRWAGALEG